MHHKKKAMQLAIYYNSQAAGYYGDVVKDILLTKCLSVESTSKCVTTSTQRRFLPSWSASLVLVQMITSSQTPSFRMATRLTAAMMQTVSGETLLKATKNATLSSVVGLSSVLMTRSFLPAKGSKRYIVLPFGSIKTYFVEERFLNQTKGQEGKEVRVNPIVPVILIPKKRTRLKVTPNPARSRKEEKK